MRVVGLVLMWIGFVAASYTAVTRAENSVPWPAFGATFAVALAGVVLARIGMRGEATHAETVRSHYEAVRSNLELVAERIADLDARKEGIDVYDLHLEIDRLFPEPLAAVAEGRKSVIQVHDLATYANMMNAFATGERYLNRVWSASVDGFVDEAHRYLGLAHAQFKEARATLGGSAAG